MRKAMIAGVLAVAFCLLLAAPVFASTSSGYLTWDAALEAYNTGITGLADESPHQGYVYNTKKCAVCHAVHKGIQGGQLLLRSTAANACIFCHVTSGSGFKQVYGGASGNYTVGTNFAHNPNGASCTSCHSVHGAKTMQNTAVKNFILRDLSTSVATVDGVAGVANHTANAPAGWKDAVVSRNQPITWFCSQCHQYYTTGTPDNNTARVEYDTVANNGSYVTSTAASHPMVAQGTFNYGSGGGRNGTLSANQKVAWADSTYCRSCHDAGTDGATAVGMNGAEFPHFTDTYARFMTYASTASSSTMASSDSSVDGACTKCHADTNTGVGYSF